MLPTIRDNDLFVNTIVFEEDSFAEHLLQILDEKDRSIAILQGMVDVAAIREAKKDRRIEELEQLVRDMQQAIVKMIVLPSYADEHEEELASFDDRIEKLGIEV